MEEFVELAGIGGIAALTHGLNRLPQLARSPLKSFDLAGELNLSLTMCRSIPGGGHLTFQFERPSFDPVNIGFNGGAGQSLIESFTQGCDGLLGELFSALCFFDPVFQLGAGFGWKRCTGTIVNGTAASPEPQHEHQQDQGAATHQRPVTDELTSCVQLNYVTDHDSYG